MPHAFRILCLITCIVCMSFQRMYAQVESYSEQDSSSLFWKKMLRPTGLSNCDPMELWPDAKAWKWTCLGPNYQPIELNPGGKAIPAYAAGRGNGTGRINYLYALKGRKDRLWACSPTGGLWFTRNGGKSWLEGGTDVLPISGVSSVAVNPQRPRQWVIATGDCDDQFMYTDGLWLTKNRGKTYRCINGGNPSIALPFCNEEGQSFVGEVVCKPDNFNYLIVASSRGLWVCNDVSQGQRKGLLGWFSDKRITGDIKWKRVAEGQFYDIEIITEPGVRPVFIAAGEKMVVSYDGGEVWQEMPAPDYPEKTKYPFLRMSLAYSSALPNFIYVAATCSERVTMSRAGAATLYLFDLRAKSWQKIRDLGEAGNVIPTRARAFAVAPDNPDKLYWANVQPVHFSDDGGKTFQKVGRNQMHDDVHHIAIDDGGRVWASHDGGVSMSNDGGVHWQSREQGIGAANIFGVSTGQTEEMNIAYGAYDTGGNLLQGKDWKHVSWGDGFETIISPSDPAVVFTTMQNGNIQATYNGRSFDEAIHTSAKALWHTWIRMHPEQHNVIYCGGERIVRSEDLGIHWKTIFDCAKVDSSLSAVYRFFLSPDHPDVMYAYVLDKATAVNPQIWRTFNLTEKDPKDIRWERVPYIPQEGWIANISIDPSNASHFWILYSRLEHDGKIWYFDGSRYTDLSYNLHDSKCESMILQHGERKRLYIGTNHGVFTKCPEDGAWTLLRGLPGTYIKSLDINYKNQTLIVGTFGRGVWQGKLVD